MIPNTVCSLSPKNLGAFSGPSAVAVGAGGLFLKKIEVTKGLLLVNRSSVPLCCCGRHDFPIFSANRAAPSSENIIFILFYFIQFLGPLQAEEAAEYERSTSDELLRTLREKEFEILQLRCVFSRH